MVISPNVTSSGGGEGNYEEIWGNYKEIWRNYAPHMAEKFRARPARRGGGGSQNMSWGGGRREKRHETCHNKDHVSYLILACILCVKEEESPQFFQVPKPRGELFTYFFILLHIFHMFRHISHILVPYWRQNNDALYLALLGASPTGCIWRRRRDRSFPKSQRLYRREELGILLCLKP